MSPMVGADFGQGLSVLVETLLWYQVVVDLGKGCVYNDQLDAMLLGKSKQFFEISRLVYHSVCVQGLVRISVVFELSQFIRWLFVNSFGFPEFVDLKNIHCFWTVD